MIREQILSMQVVYTGLWTGHNYDGRLVSGFSYTLNIGVWGSVINGFLPDLGMHSFCPSSTFCPSHLISLPKGLWMWASNTLHQCRAQLHKILYRAVPLSPPSFFLSGRRVKSILCAPAIVCRVEWQECTQKRMRAKEKRKGWGDPWQALVAVKKGTTYRRGGRMKVKASSSGMGRLGSVTA